MKHGELLKTDIDHHVSCNGLVVVVVVLVMMVGRIGVQDQAFCPCLFDLSFTAFLCRLLHCCSALFFFISLKFHHCVFWILG